MADHQAALSLLSGLGRTCRSRLGSSGHRLRKIKKGTKVEHPFRVIKRLFGYTKARFRGLTKNDVQW
ncbi:hypothetical protein L346_05669 [Pseudomonas aeruginosa MSH-10]|nr:hypothetical protein L346_05669 [Pseudomonas aeruginosa MSH-10]ERU51658.1 hypothetical protein Q089_05430 [Pseudomonas aeruginosa C48]ERX75890.1 hypothetical protein P999_00223 [Pseudomonas aeruginosa MSH3]ERZ37127.1 hypothetical protein Q000_04177 [Pseudomonas aeruginosa MSH10]